MMSIGEKFSVICLDCIPDNAERNRVLASLEKSFEVIPISMDQMENHFCGNILQVNSVSGDPLIVMSKRTYNGFKHLQREQLEQYGKLVAVDLDTIETIGGGSARCMMAEIFSQRKAEKKP